MEQAKELDGTEPQDEEQEDEPSGRAQWFEERARKVHQADKRPSSVHPLSEHESIESRDTGEARKWPSLRRHRPVPPIAGHLF